MVSLRSSEIRGQRSFFTLLQDISRHMGNYCKPKGHTANPLAKALYLAWSPDVYLSLLLFSLNVNILERLFSPALIMQHVSVNLVGVA